MVGDADTSLHDVLILRYHLIGAGGIAEVAEHQPDKTDSL